MCKAWRGSTNATGAAYGQTPRRRTDPVVSTRAGLSYFKDLLAQEGNIPKALTRYNGGSDPHFAQHVLARYPTHTATQAPAEYERLMGPSVAVLDGKAEYERLMGRPEAAPDGKAEYERLMGPATPGPARPGPAAYRAAQPQSDPARNTGVPWATPQDANEREAGRKHLTPGSRA